MKIPKKLPAWILPLLEYIGEKERCKQESKKLSTYIQKHYSSYREENTESKESTSEGKSERKSKKNNVDSNETVFDGSLNKEKIEKYKSSLENLPEEHLSSVRKDFETQDIPQNIDTAEELDHLYGVFKSEIGRKDGDTELIVNSVDALYELSKSLL